MFLVFGIKRTAHRLATVFALCGHCGTPAAHVIGRRSTWFSLFFVPVIPLGSKYFSTCTFCGVSTKIERDQATQMVAAGAQASAPSAPPHAPQTDARGQSLPPPAAPLHP